MGDGLEDSDEHLELAGTGLPPGRGSLNKAHSHSLW